MASMAWLGVPTGWVGIYIWLLIAVVVMDFSLWLASGIAWLVTWGMNDMNARLGISACVLVIPIVVMYFGLAVVCATGACEQEQRSGTPTAAAPR